MSTAIDLARRVLARGGAGIEHDAPRIGAAQPAAWLAEGRAVRRPVVRATALAVGIVPFAAYATLILYHFYIRGGFLWDSGLLAFLIGASDPRLPVPPIMADGSFFAIHVTPIFAALSPIRSLLPLTGPQFFALFSGLCHALPALAVFWVLYSGYRLRTRWGVGVAAVLARAFSFHALALAIARHPPFEMLVVGSALRFIVALFWAVRNGNPYLVLGYAGFLPWATLHLVAESDIAGTLSGYYAYPFLIASFWPLVAVLVERRGRALPSGALPAVLGFAAMIGASFTALGYQANPGHIELPAGFWSPPSLARQAATDNALGQIVHAKTTLGSVMVDGSVLGLVPDGFSKNETVWESGGRLPDTVVYFAGAYESEAARTLAAKASLDHHYGAHGSAIRLWRRRAVDPASPLGSVLAPAAASE